MKNDIRLIFPINERYQKLYPEGHMEDWSPVTRALAFCLEATGMRKLFTREDVHEFVLRLAITCKPLQATEMFFTHEYLLKFTYAKKLFYITAQDIANHIGMQITDFPGKPFPRDEWAKFKRAHWRNVVLRVESLDFIDATGQPVVEKDNANDIDLWFEAGTLPGADELKNASILADSVVADIAVCNFEQFSVSNRAFLKKLARYNEISKLDPPLTYDWDQFPASKQDEILKLLFRKIYQKGINLETIKKDHFAPASELLHLAWLFANGFVWHASRCILDPRYKINLKSKFYHDFDRESGPDLKLMYCVYNIGKIISLLEENAEIKKKTIRA